MNSPWQIVCVSHLEWTESLFQRPQQVMGRLSQNQSVLYCYPLALRQWAGALTGGAPAARRLKINDNLTVLREYSLLPAWGGRLGQFQRVNDRRFVNSIVRASRNVPPSRRILWYYYPRHLELIEALEPALVVYECMDNYTALFSRKDDPLQAAAFQTLQYDEALLLKRADVLFYGSKTLMDERTGGSAKSHHFPTGVDADHFGRAADAGELPGDIAAIRRPILGYWGAIDNRIDFRLLADTAKRRPDWSFVMLGPLVTLTQDSISHFLQIPNVHWLGPKRYETIPDYARAFDLCLMPFKTGEEGRYLNPTKTLEYLATGKPVISTQIPDVERFYSDRVSIIGNPAEFMAAAVRLLEHDTASARAKRVATATGRSWEAMTAAMWALVEERLGERPEPITGTTR